MKRAGAYWRAGNLFIYSEHGIPSGYLAQDDAISLPQTDLGGIGVAARVKLDSYVETVSSPRWDLMKGDQSPNLHAAAGVRSSSEFVKGAKWVGIKLNEGLITLVPGRNEGARRGFRPIRERERVVRESCSDEELGAAILAAFAEAD